MTHGRTFRRPEAARLLQAHGLRTTAASLATMATRGGGPRFFKVGKLCMYPLSDLESWVAQRTTGLLDSTSTTKGARVDDSLQPDYELDDDLFITGHPGFDEITRLLDQEAEMQAHMDAARIEYDEQFA
ncbi:hypothetical protein ACFOKF_02750 [Sphingobium rhizovicinum]|uniref:DNA-binding protein n=1 Tax=Sphingobium rhizovicinum TaxID=432308 RepID=A0ABV7NCE5_9SPHN